MKIFIGNLKRSVNESDLEDLFDRNGFEIKSLLIRRDRFTGESRGFAFVDLPDDQAERAILEMNGASFRGGLMVVENDKTQRSS
jgi:RNA recognition motif-containing protein